MDIEIIKSNYARLVSNRDFMRTTYILGFVNGVIGLSVMYTLIGESLSVMIPLSIFTFVSLAGFAYFRLRYLFYIEVLKAFSECDIDKLNRLYNMEVS